MLVINDNQLKLYSNVKATEVDWLWYPYIPFGKITLIQGDPGGGKSTLMMNIISSLSNGTCLPDGTKHKKPMHVIYQCSEDSVSDTIKPRLLKAGADCNNVAFIDEDICQFTLDDEKIRRAIADFNAKLLVIDPVQAYLGNADISNANSIRHILKQLSIWATSYDCAIVLIGHLNKNQSTKDLYRSLGSIDFIAAARSVLYVEQYEENSNVKVVKHIKSSLAPPGNDLFFSFDNTYGIKWEKINSLSTVNKSVNRETEFMETLTKQEFLAKSLKTQLACGPVKATDILQIYRSMGISEKTLQITKKIIGIQSVRMNGAWYWSFPGCNNSSDKGGAV